MKSKLLIFIAIILCTITYSQENKNMGNPFFKEWNTPFQTPPFNEIKTEHFLPAIEEGIKLEKASFPIMLML